MKPGNQGYWLGVLYRYPMRLVTSIANWLFGVTLRLPKFLTKRTLCQDANK